MVALPRRTGPIPVFLGLQAPTTGPITTPNTLPPSTTKSSVQFLQASSQWNNRSAYAPIFLRANYYYFYYFILLFADTRGVGNSVVSPTIPPKIMLFKSFCKGVLYLYRWVKINDHTGARASVQYTATLRVERAATAAAHY